MLQLAGAFDSPSGALGRWRKRERDMKAAMPAEYVEELRRSDLSYDPVTTRRMIDEWLWEEEPRKKGAKSGLTLARAYRTVFFNQQNPDILLKEFCALKQRRSACHGAGRRFPPHRNHCRMGRCKTR